MTDARIKKDLLAKLLARRQITFSEYLAGREWQDLLQRTYIQGGTCYDWEASIYDQRLYQADGVLTDSQCDAISARNILKVEIGKLSHDDLDRLLSVPEGVRVNLSEEGAKYVSRLLQIVGVVLDVQAGGTDFGAAQEEWERKPDRTAELRKEQPWLFEPKQQNHKPSAAQIRARNAV